MWAEAERFLSNEQIITGMLKRDIKLKDIFF
jgi:hypothetical protein